jgi:thymidylate synthase (FAD)
MKTVMPKVYIISLPSLNHDAVNRFLEAENVPNWNTDAEHPSDKLCEIAGRVCYMSFGNPRPGGNAAYFANILQSGHGSVLEHANFSMLITGVSRSLSHELVRHRAGWAYSQLSQRYVDESDVAFVVPIDLMHDVNEQTVAGKSWIECCEQSLKTYAELTEHLASKAADRGLEKTEARKFARQAARSVLPNATETKIVGTANIRALRHFCELRGSVHAEPEIRRLANMMLRELQLVTNLFDDMIVTDRFGIQTPYHKV